MTDTPIPSAVVLPDEAASELPPPTNGLKRRQSDIPSQDQEQEQEQESKRQRISSPGKNSPPAAARDTSTTDPTHSTKQEKPAESRQDRRKSSIADEKQRSRRLFGALLGSLNPAASDRTSKRRAEIESRRKAELQRQDDERVEDKLRREERVKEQRRIVQERVEGENMRIRHANLLHTANFLQTSSEPRVYYRPWELRADEEARIEDQMKDAQAQIDKELDEVNKRDRPDPKSEIPVDANPPAATNEANADDGTDVVPKTVPTEESSDGHSDSKTADAAEDQAPAKSAANDEEDSKPAEVPESDPTNSDTNIATKSEAERPKDEKLEDAPEDEGEHVVEGDEDTVIY